MLSTECVEGCGPCEDCCACTPAETDGQPTESWRLFAWLLTVATVGWNVIEAAVAIASGWASRSIALIGFGLDSAIEVTSALVVVWRLTTDAGEELAEAGERRAVRLIALSFFLLTGYVTLNAISTLARAEAPQQSPTGLVLLALSLIVMPGLFVAKRRVAARAGSVMLGADASQTKVCTYLSGAVLLGVAGNAMLGWWWLDPIAGLAVAAVAAREGRNAWVSGELCGEEHPWLELVCSPACCQTCPAFI
jgi:divalent metal cation (Fe/Co/Zn/Cd) transporter